MKWVNPADRKAIEGSPDHALGITAIGEHVIVVLGNLKCISFSKSYFQDNPICAPDFTDCEVTDCGQTLRFGAFEADLSAILANTKNEKDN